jgi:hypothetical protein
MQKRFYDSLDCSSTFFRTISVMVGTDAIAPSPVSPPADEKEGILEGIKVTFCFHIKLRVILEKEKEKEGITTYTCKSNHSQSDWVSEVKAPSTSF